MTTADATKARTVTFVVGDGDDGTRLDKLVTRRVDGLGRTGARSLFGKGAVLVDGRRARKGDPARRGEEVRVELGPPRRALPDPETTLDVRHESRSVLVVRKPAGQPTAPLTGAETGTIANALVARYPETAAFGFSPLEPGLLHRLDTKTSGLLVAARSRRAFEHLRIQFDRLTKRYAALVDPRVPESGFIETPLEPDPDDPARVRVAKAGKPRTSRYQRLRSGSTWALVEVEVGRAYRHQIRVHLARAGHPIAGDVTYGGEPVESLASRHALHASYIAWAGDDTVEGFEVSDELPAEFETLLAV